MACTVHWLAASKLQQNRYVRCTARHPFMWGAPSQILVGQMILDEATAHEKEQPAFRWCIGKIVQNFGPLHRVANAVLGRVLLLFPCLTLSIVNAHGTAEIENSLTNLILGSIADDLIHCSPFANLVHERLWVILVGFAKRIHRAILGDQADKELCDLSAVTQSWGVAVDLISRHRLAPSWNIQDWIG